MTFTHALATNNYGTAKFIVAISAANGTHTTLASAMASAVAGDTIFLRDSVTENVTITPGVNISAFGGSGYTSNATITGKITMLGAGTSTISGIRLQTNSDFCVVVSGSVASILNLDNCYINCTNNTGISYTSSSASSQILMSNCFGDLGTTGIALYSMSSVGSLLIRYTKMTNTGASTTASSNSAGAVTVMNCIMNIAFSNSSTGTTIIDNTQVDTTAINTTCLTTAGNGVQSSISSYFASGTASGISIGAGTTLNAGCVTVNSGNTNAITGAGTLINAGVSLIGSVVINTSTQTAKNFDVGGVSFDGGANTLSAYTVGTFAPTFIGNSSAGTTTYTVQNGYYVRVGAMVQVQGIVVGTGATGTGDILFNNLPFTVKNQTNGSTFGSILTSQSWAWPASKTQILFNPGANSVNATVAGIQSNGTTANVQMTNTNFNMQFNVTYEI